MTEEPLKLTWRIKWEAGALNTEGFHFPRNKDGSFVVAWFLNRMVTKPFGYVKGVL